MYDPATGQWSATGDMTSPRVLHTLTLLPNGKVLAVGGSSANIGGLSKSSELYDPTAGAWTAAAELSVATLREIAETLEIPPEQFAELWLQLPLDDATIAGLLDLTQQQVINLRKSARERLARRLKGFF